jgi:hypothetical protein
MRRRLRFILPLTNLVLASILSAFAGKAPGCQDTYTCDGRIIAIYLINAPAQIARFLAMKLFDQIELNLCEPSQSAVCAHIYSVVSTLCLGVGILVLWYSVGLELDVRPRITVVRNTFFSRRMVDAIVVLMGLALGFAAFSTWSARLDSLPLLRPLLATLCYACWAVVVIIPFGVDLIRSFRTGGLGAGGPGKS